MRQTLIAVLLTVAAATFSQSASATMHAHYFYGTGNIWLEEVSGVGGISLKGPNLDLDPAPDALGGFVDTSIAGEVSWLFFTPKAGSVNLGNLLPTNLHQGHLDTLYFVGVVIMGSGNPNPVKLSISGVPEPASVAMAGLGVIGCMSIRRRASCRRC